ncbi:hypothetical protein ABZP36_030475 [Zizania latifolia]
MDGAGGRPTGMVRALVRGTSLGFLSKGLRFARWRVTSLRPASAYLSSLSLSPSSSSSSLSLSYIHRMQHRTRHACIYPYHIYIDPSPDRSGQFHVDFQIHFRKLKTFQKKR